jgi:Bacterial SH3 domain
MKIAALKSVALAIGLGCVVGVSVATPGSAKFEGMDRCFSLVVFDPNDRSVNLRQTPNGVILQKFPNGTVVNMPVTEPAGIDPGWTQVRKGASSSIGYVSSKLLYYTVYAARDPNDRTVNLRKQPNGAIIRALPNGTEVSFVGIQDNWMRVEVQESGERGYISTKLLKRTTCF